MSLNRTDMWAWARSMNDQSNLVEVECPKCHGKGHLPARASVHSDGRVYFGCVYLCLRCMGKGWVPVSAFESSLDPANPVHHQALAMRKGLETLND